MKIKSIILLLLVATFFCSCEKDLFNPETVKHDTKTVTDLVIPEGFDWNMVTSVTTHVSSTTNTLVSLYVDDSYTDKSKAASFITTSGSVDTLPLCLPSYLKEVYLKYLKQNGDSVKTKIPVLDGAVSFSLPADSKQEVVTKTTKSVVTKADDASSKTTSTAIFYPGGSWGTLMFEDMFPALGDYDFNDVVTNYKILLYLNPKDHSNVLGLNIAVTVKALGGDIPYDLYLRFKGINNRELDIASQYVYTSNNGRNDNVLLVNPNDLNANVVYSFQNLMNNTEKNKGANYLNTQADFLTTKLNTANFIIFFDNPIDVSRLPFNCFDFFIAKKDRSTEIHTKGNTSVFTSYQTASGLGKAPYTSDKGYVWAINVPYQIDHLIEGTNFLLGYPMFAEWAESGGVRGLEWYKTSSSNVMTDKNTGKQVTANPVSKYMIRL